MRTIKYLFCLIFCFIIANDVNCQAITIDKTAALKDILKQLAQKSNDEYFIHHCNSILKVIESKTVLSSNDSSILADMYIAFSDATISWNASELSSYTERKRPFIFSWTSPDDGEVSTGWLLLPENWDPDKKYPLYVRLHGLWDPYENTVEYISLNLKPGATINTAFEDGYIFYPWGRGNLWYMKKGETDIWEGLDSLENFIKIDSTRRYLTGFSMGGFGTWYLGELRPDKWAALGIFAGALWYENRTILRDFIAERLKDVPVYFICGTQDGLLEYNQTAYNLLQDAGNTNLSFNTFNGGHETTFETWQGMYQWIRNFTNNKVQTGMEQPEVSDLKLYNYPNPFKSETTIFFPSQKDKNCSLEVFNIVGEKVRSLTVTSNSASDHSTRWNGDDDYGVPVPQGIYLIRLKTPDYEVTGKMLRVK